MWNSMTYSSDAGEGSDPDATGEEKYVKIDE